MTAFHNAQQGGSNDDEQQAVFIKDDIFFSKQPPRQNIVVNSAYLESIWTWICQHKDISVKQDTPISSEIEKQRISLDQYVFLDGHKTSRLFTTEQQTWHALTGHGIDHKKVPKLEFQCLSVIAEHGPGGVLQPDVVAQTGQDKRSLPKRTESLASKGYITKEPCIGSGTRTSLLRLKRFTDEAKLRGSDQQITTGDLTSNVSVIRYDQWFDGIIALLQKQAGPLPFLKLRSALVSRGQSRAIVHDSIHDRSLTYWNRALGRIENI